MASRLYRTTRVLYLHVEQVLHRLHLATLGTVVAINLIRFDFRTGRR